MSTSEYRAANVAASRRCLARAQYIRATSHSAVYYDIGPVVRCAMLKALADAAYYRRRASAVFILPS